MYKYLEIDRETEQLNLLIPNCFLAVISAAKSTFV